ncbi:MAG TPA: TRAM domain-containing protein, partial [Sunxiuqinia sp.]|nr:TRAM domain-containing protein [Sunxiuqinia sp.]
LDDKKDRYHRLTDVVKSHTRVYNEGMVGKTFRVLVNGSDRKTGFSNGLTEGKLNVRLDRKAPELMGQIVDVKITSAADFSMSGELVFQEEKIES